ncbi:hypothetical protein [Microbacterium atlanticum]|uniref:hypothetical protein n=1 Tax=Microbacterium atlanticum TaxID=2782168 RepID=UPI0018892503|nr:hypothetical protein [Microbacterium atlanticum]
MRNRGVAAIGIALVLALSGCSTPEPPAPTPTAAFASEEEAFAAAEATYRAYVDALNAVDLSDPETFEGVYEWTTGEANASDRKSLSSFHADGVTVVGESVVTRLELAAYEPMKSEVSLDVCVDVSSVDLLDASGQSIVDSTRPDMQRTTVSLVHEPNAPRSLLIEDISARQDGPPCS